MINLACGVEQDGATDTTRSTPDFAVAAQDVFAELAVTPFDGRSGVEVGLFGDLDVMAGDNVVMGRYRFRVDTTAVPATADMVFQLRGHEGVLVPVLLHFSAAPDMWRLEEARYLRHEGMSQPFSVTLRSEFDSWVSRSVAAAPSVR